MDKQEIYFMDIFLMRLMDYVLEFSEFSSDLWIQWMLIDNIFIVIFLRRIVIFLKVFYGYIYGDLNGFYFRFFVRYVYFLFLIGLYCNLECFLN